MLPIGLEEGSLIRRACRPDGQPSCTEYRVVRTCEQASLARCITVTGRTHQIRVHFAQAGHPLLGDDLYGGSRELIGRTALHCGWIRVEMPQWNAARTFACPLPSDMEALIFHIFHV